MIYYSPSSHYRLATSINLSGICWGTPVVPWFSGTLEGDGHTISHLKIIGGSHLGLLGELADGAEVRDLRVVDVNIEGSGDYVGGMAGTNNGSMTQCCCTGLISGVSCVGGLVGYNSSSIIQCFSAGSVKGTGEYTGGLIGITRDGSYVSRCYNTATVIGNDRVGGLVGDIDTGENMITWGGHVVQSYSAGSVIGASGVGGLAGGDGGFVAHCFWDTEISGQTTSAGGGTGKTTAEMQDPNTFIADAWDFAPHDIWFEPEGGGYPILWWQLSPLPDLPRFSGGTGEPNDPYLISTPEELNSIGHNPRLMECNFKLADDLDLAGLNFFPIGSHDYPYRGVFDCDGHTISHMTIEGDAFLGLFGATASGAKVRDLGVVDIGIFGSVDYVGGVVGQNGGCLICCWSSGIVHGNYHIGGLIGQNLSDGEVISCYSTGEINGVGSITRGTGENAGVGGLVGTSSGDVSKCYSICTVSGRVHVGGLIGLGFERGDIAQCYSTGRVSGQYYVGGLMGSGNAEYVTGCFWDTETSGQTESAGGTGKTTAVMQTTGTFLAAGWDFVGETENGTDNIWWIDEGRDYPRLWWETE